MLLSEARPRPYRTTDAERAEYRDWLNMRKDFPVETDWRERARFTQKNAENAYNLAYQNSHENPEEVTKNPHWALKEYAAYYVVLSLSRAFNAKARKYFSKYTIIPRMRLDHADSFEIVKSIRNDNYYNRAKYRADVEPYSFVKDDENDLAVVSDVNTWTSLGQFRSFDAYHMMDNPEFETLYDKLLEMANTAFGYSADSTNIDMDVNNADWFDTVHDILDNYLDEEYSEIEDQLVNIILKSMTKAVAKANAEYSTARTYIMNPANNAFRRR